MHLPHPLCITLRQIVVDRDNMHALPFQRIQIGRQKTGLCLSFAGSHLRDPSLMQDNTADQLHSVMLRVENPPGRLADKSIRLRQKVVQSLPFGESFLELLCLITHLLFRQFHHPGTHALDSVNQTVNALDLPFTVRSEYFLYHAHNFLIPMRPSGLTHAFLSKKSPQYQNTKLHFTRYRG